MSTNNIKIFDLEVFPNYFLAGFMGLEKENVDMFEIAKVNGEEVNEVHSLVSFISDRWLVGFNSRDYDNQIIQYILERNEEWRAKPAGLIAQDIYDLSTAIINGEKEYKKWNPSFHCIDLKRVGNIDKSLKMCGVDLRHHNILDLIRAHDEPVTADEVKPIRDYNYNDLDTTTDLYHELRDDIIMRKKLSVQYETDIMDYADSGMADRLLGKFYSERTGLGFWDFINESTERRKVELDDIIFDKIRFSTDKMKEFLESVKKQSLTENSKFQRRLRIGDTYYDMLKGGLHSVRPPEIFKPTDDMYIVEADVSSYYPNAMINNGIKPAHLLNEFLDILKDITHTRLKAKAEEDWATSDGLKKTINSVFGKMGYPYSWMYDLKAMYGVTINCQLFLLMLIEMLEENNFTVFYGNTDGLFTKVPKDRWDEYEYICQRWQDYTEFDLDFEKYNKCVIRDVNNYLIEKRSGDLKMKGAFDTERHEDLTKGYKYPVVPLAVRDYFISGISPEETIQNHEDILDFCIAQKVGGKFSVKFNYIKNNRLVEEDVQKTNRYYVAKRGGSLIKKASNKRIQMVSGEAISLLNKCEDRDASSYSIKHSYYIREAYKIINEFSTKQQTLF